MTRTAVSKVVLMTLLSAAYVTPANGNMFLARQDRGGGLDTMSVEVKKALLAELEKSLGSSHRSFTERRLAKIEEVLRPIYNSVPKNENGLLGHSAVAFLLHRVFVLRHGWFVRGLDPEDHGSAAFNSSSTSAFLEDKVPEHIQDVFDQRIGGKGFASWRKPRGIDCPVRRRYKGQIKMPKIGYGSNKKTRHMLPNGFFKFSVTSEQDIELLLMHNGKYAAELANNLSAKTRKAIIARADQLNVCVLNRKAKLSTEETE